MPGRIECCQQFRQRLGLSRGNIAKRSARVQYSTEHDLPAGQSASRGRTNAREIGFCQRSVISFVFDHLDLLIHVDRLWKPPTGGTSFAKCELPWPSSPVDLSAPSSLCPLQIESLMSTLVMALLSMNTSSH
jgi:hypothetical protein